MYIQAQCAEIRSFRYIFNDYNQWSMKALHRHRGKDGLKRASPLTNKARTRQKKVRGSRRAWEQYGTTQPGGAGTGSGWEGQDKGGGASKFVII